MNRGQWRIIGACAMAVIVAALGLGGIARGADPVAAFVEVNRTAVGDQIGAALLKLPDIHWVERQALDQVLAERQLQEAFTAAGAAARLNVGQITKADALVLFRSQPLGGKQGVFTHELVVCETRRGLRLVTLQIQSEAKQPLDIEALVQTIAQGVRRANQPIRMVCAVTPFLNRDARFRLAHLSSAMAQTIANRLLANDGVALVEIAEARAITTERLVQVQPENSGAAAPIFVNGEYTPTENGDRIRLKMSIERQGVDIGAAFDEVLDVKGAQNSVIEWTDAWLRRVGNLTPQPSSAEQTAQKLFAKAKEFSRLQLWPETWHCVEAALLFQQDDVDLRLLAFLAADHVTYGYFADSSKQNYRNWRELSSCYYRTIEHYRYAIEHTPLDKYQEQRQIYSLPHTRLRASCINRVESLRPWRQPDIRIYEEMHQAEIALLLGCYKACLRQGLLMDAHAFLANYLKKLDPDDVKQQFPRYVLAIPSHRRRTYVFELLLQVVCGYYLNIEDYDLSIELVQAVEAQSKDDELTRFAGLLIQSRSKQRDEKLAREIARVGKPWPALTSEADGYREIRWQIHRKNEQGKVETSTELRPGGAELAFLAAGPGVDIAWSRNEIFWVRQPGELELIFDFELKPVLYGKTNACFDGRYAWLVVSPKFDRERHLFVVDPQSGKVWDSGVDFGLPLLDDKTARDLRMTQDIKIAAIAPGEVLTVSKVVDTTIGRVKFSPTDNKPFRGTVLHECSETTASKQDDRWSSAKLRFQPNWIAVAIQSTSPANLQGLAVIARGSDWPLFVDLSSNSVSVSPVPIKVNASRGMIHHGDRLYYCDEHSGGPNQRCQLFAYDLKTKRTTLVNDDIPKGEMFFHDDALSILGNQWWVGTPTGVFRAASGTMPWFATHWAKHSGSQYGMKASSELGYRALYLDKIHRSSHYGLIASAAKAIGTQGWPWTTLTVDFPAQK